MSVLYAELRPQQFRERLATAPIAYLPLGTLEWHGEHLPLGSDGLQSQGFFVELAEEVGGIVLPMLFLGPDRMRETETGPLYGMDLCLTSAPEYQYPTQQLDGSAYWAPDALYHDLLRATLAQLARAGFGIVVGHGHGPSTRAFAEGHDEWRDSFGLETLTCWGSDVDREGLGIQVDHAAMNETSLMMALHPDLVDLTALSDDPAIWPVGVGGRDPRVHASRELGLRIIALQKERMAGLLRVALAALPARSV
jgi:creatinine amidohydrolase